MTIGTRSVLYGAHCFLLHPWFVAWGWWKLYGFPWAPRLWVAFFVHDLGYIGKPNMDGEEGESHPELGARIMGSIFDQRWHDFCLLHSRFYARAKGRQPSRLCYADKLALILTPPWLYLPMVRATGELSEYMSPELHKVGGKHRDDGIDYRGSPAAWHESMVTFLRGWLEKNAA